MIRMRFSFSMIMFLFLSALGASIPSQAQSRDAEPSTAGKLTGLFQQANSLYEKGEYEEAIAGYEKIAKAGVEDENLFYNLGNAYYKNGNLGKAILSYERALKLNPRDKDAKQNLSLARSLIRDKQFVKKEIWLTKIVSWLYKNLRLDEIIILASVFYLLLCIVLVFLIFLDSSPSAKSLYKRASFFSPGRLLGLTPKQDLISAVVVLSFFFLSASALSADRIIKERSRRAAIVIEEEVAVYSAPSKESTLEFKIHEGTKVNLKEKRAGWVRIDLPGGLSGWIVKDAVESV